MDTILEQFLKNAGGITGTSVLVIIVIGFVKGWIVTGDSYRKRVDELQKDVEFYRALSFKFAEITERTQQVRERKT